MQGIAKECHGVPSQRQWLAVHKMHICAHAIKNACKLHGDVASAHNDNAGIGQVIQHESIV